MTDRVMVDPEALTERKRLREVTGGDADLVPVGLQSLDHGPHDEHMRRVGEVDPDPHRPSAFSCQAAASAATTSAACSGPSTGLIGSAMFVAPSRSVTGRSGGVPAGRYGAIDGWWCN